MGSFCSVIDMYSNRCDRFLTAVQMGDIRGALAELTSMDMLECKTAAGRTALEVATLQKHEEMMEFLLMQGANPDCGQTIDTDPLFSSCYHGWTYILRHILREHPELVYKKRTKELLSRNGEQHSVSFGLIHMVPMSHQPLAVLEALLDTRADFCTPDSQGNTALHHAARSTPLSMRFFRVLLREFVMRLRPGVRGLDARNAAGYTALEYALKAGNLRAASELLKYGADMRTLRNPSARVLRLLLSAAPNRQQVLDYVEEVNKTALSTLEHNSE